MVGIADKPVEISVSELLCFDEKMQIRRRVLPHRFEIIRLENAEHLERGDSLIIGRQLPHAISVKRHRDWCHPVRRILAHVIERDETLQLGQSVNDAPAYRATVER